MLVKRLVWIVMYKVHTIDTFVQKVIDKGNYIQLFITYKGMQVLFSSRGNTTMSFNVTIFRNWYNMYQEHM